MVSLSVQFLVIMETGEVGGNNEAKTTIIETEENIKSEKDLKQKPKSLKEHRFFTQTEACLSTTSKHELQDLLVKYKIY